MGFRIAQKDQDRALQNTHKQQRHIAHLTMAKLILQKVVPVTPDSKAHRVIRWLYRAVFPEIMVNEGENDTVYFNAFTILGTSLWTHSDLLLRETGGRGKTGDGAVTTHRQQSRWHDSRLPFCCGPEKKTEAVCSRESC